MNHFLGLLVLSVWIAAIFAFVNREGSQERIRYFLTLMAYMAGGSLAFAWLMYFLPW